MRLALLCSLALFVAAVAAQSPFNLGGRSWSVSYSSPVQIKTFYSGSAGSGNGVFQNGAASYMGYGRGSNWNSAASGYDSTLYNGGKFQGSSGLYSGYGSGGLDYYWNWRKNGYVTAKHNLQPYTGGYVVSGSGSSSAGSVGNSGASGFGVGALGGFGIGGGRFGTAGAGSGFGAGGAGSGFGTAGFGSGYTTIGGGRFGAAGAGSGFGAFGAGGAGSGFGTAGVGKGYSTIAGSVFGLKGNQFGNYGAGGYGSGTSWNSGSLFAPGGVNSFTGSASTIAGVRPISFRPSQISTATSGLYTDSKWSDRGVYSGYGDGLDYYWRWRKNGFHGADHVPTGAYTTFTSGSLNKYPSSQGGALYGSGFGKVSGFGSAGGLTSASGFGAGSGVGYGSGGGLASVSGFASGNKFVSGSGLYGTGAPYGSDSTGSYVYSKWSTGTAPAPNKFFSVYGTKISDATVPAVATENYGQYFTSKYQSRPLSTTGVYPMYTQSQWTTDNSGRRTDYYTGYGKATTTFIKPTYAESFHTRPAHLSPASFPNTVGTVGSTGFSSNLYTADRFNTGGIYDGYGNGLDGYWKWRKNGFHGADASSSGIYSGFYSGGSTGGGSLSNGALVTRPASTAIYTSYLRPSTASSTYIGGLASKFTSPAVATTVFGTSAYKPAGYVAGVTNISPISPAVTTFSSGTFGTRPAATVIGGANNLLVSTGGGKFGTYSNLNSQPFVTSVGTPMYTQPHWNVGSGYLGGYGKLSGATFRPVSTKQTYLSTATSAGSVLARPSGLAPNLYSDSKWSKQGVHTGYGDLSYYWNWRKNGFQGGNIVPVGSYGGYIGSTSTLSGTGLDGSGFDGGYYTSKVNTAKFPISSIGPGSTSSIYTSKVSSSRFPTGGFISGIRPGYSTTINTSPSIGTTVFGVSGARFPSTTNAYISTNYQSRPLSTSGITPMYTQSKWTLDNSGRDTNYFNGYGQQTGAIYSTTAKYRPNYAGSKLTTIYSGQTQFAPAVFPATTGTVGTAGFNSNLYANLIRPGSGISGNGFASGYDTSKVTISRPSYPATYIATSPSVASSVFGVTGSKFGHFPSGSVGNYYAPYGQISGTSYSTTKYQPSIAGSSISSIQSGAAQLNPAAGTAGSLYGDGKWSNQGVYSGYAGDGLAFYWKWRNGGFTGGDHKASGLFSSNVYNKFGGSLGGGVASGNSFGTASSGSLISSGALGSKFVSRPYAGSLGLSSMYSGSKWNLNSGGRNSGLLYGYGLGTNKYPSSVQTVYSGSASLSPAIYPSGSAAGSQGSAGYMGSLYNNGEWRNSGVYSGYGTDLDSYWRWRKNGFVGEGSNLYTVGKSGSRYSTGYGSGSSYAGSLSGAGFVPGFGGIGFNSAGFNGAGVGGAGFAGRFGSGSGLASGSNSFGSSWGNGQPGAYFAKWSTSSAPTTWSQKVSWQGPTYSYTKSW